MTPYRLKDRIALILADDQKTDVDSHHGELAERILASLTDYQAQDAKIKALTETLEHYSDVYCEGYCSISDTLDHDCGGCPARVAIAAAKEPT